MSRMLLTCFADEISHDIHEQMDVLEQEGLKHLELRGLWGKNILELDRNEVELAGRSVRSRGFGISSLGTPIGKYPITADFRPQLAALNRAIDAAHTVGAQYIRIFSYHPAEEGWTTESVFEVLQRMQMLTRLAEDRGVVLILENDNNMYGTTPSRSLELLNHCGSTSLCMAFDPGNFVINSIKPMQEAYPLLKEHIGYVHVKDAATDHFVPAGLGDGEIPELIAALKERSYSGFLSVEPHLQHYLPHHSNPKRVITAIRALKSLLDQAGVQWV